MPATPAPTGPFRIDGEDVSLTSLTFREQRQLRQFVRELSDDPDVMPADAPLMDFLPALVAVVRARSREDASPQELLEEALEMNFSDVIPEPEARPTRRSSSRSTASKKTAAAAAGTPRS